MPVHTAANVDAMLRRNGIEIPSPSDDAAVVAKVAELGFAELRERHREISADKMESIATRAHERGDAAAELAAVRGMLRLVLAAIPTADEDSEDDPGSPDLIEAIRAVYAFPMLLKHASSQGDLTAITCAVDTIRLRLEGFAGEVGAIDSYLRQVDKSSANSGKVA